MKSEVCTQPLLLSDNGCARTCMCVCVCVWVCDFIKRTMVWSRRQLPAAANTLRLNGKLIRGKYWVMEICKFQDFPTIELRLHLTKRKKIDFQFLFDSNFLAFMASYKLYSISKYLILFSLLRTSIPAPPPKWLLFISFPPLSKRTAISHGKALYSAWGHHSIENWLTITIHWIACVAAVYHVPAHRCELTYCTAQYPDAICDPTAREAF